LGAKKTYYLLGPDLKKHPSKTKGQLGGHYDDRIYGRLHCSTALRAIAKGGYVANRVFFADEEAAIAAGFRPCGNCMRERYRQWKQGGELGTDTYPWLRGPTKS
jgi:hypothetical protein